MFYQDFTKEIAHCKTDIKTMKMRLIAKAKSRGIWENFGQTEVRKLRDTYFRYVYECKEIRDLLNNFDDWAMNYTGR